MSTPDLGALASLTGANTSAALPSLYQTGQQDVNVAGKTLPAWYPQLAGNFANAGNQFLNQDQNLNANWYSNPITAGFTGLQNNAINNVSATGGYDTTPQQTAAQGALSHMQTSYDPSQTQNFMSPYLNGADQAVYNLGNQNLMEQVLPQVNSTFTGAGQFGGSRNADFENRAIRDAGQAESNAVANLNNTAYGNAQQQQLAWNGQPAAAATAQEQLGTTGLQNYWNNVNPAYNMGTSEQNIQQNALNTNYQNWMNSITTPQNMYGALSSALPAYSSMWSGLPASSATTVAPLNQSNNLQQQGLLTQGLSSLFGG